VEYQDYHDGEWDDSEDGVVGEGGSLLACAVFSQESGAVRPELNLEDDESTCPAELCGWCG